MAGRNIQVLSLGTANWQSVRPEPGLPPARGSQALDRGGSWRGPSKAGKLVRAGRGIPPYRALGTSTGPRPPPGPGRGSPPYFSSMPAQEPLPTPRALLMSRCRCGSAGAGASLPHISRVLAGSAVPAASPGSAGRDTHFGRD